MNTTTRPNLTLVVAVVATAVLFLSGIAFLRTGAAMTGDHVRHSWEECRASGGMMDASGR